MLELQDAKQMAFGNNENQADGRKEDDKKALSQLAKFESLPENQENTELDWSRTKRTTMRSKTRCMKTTRKATTMPKGSSMAGMTIWKTIMEKRVLQKRLRITEPVMRSL